LATQGKLFGYSQHAASSSPSEVTIVGCVAFFGVTGGTAACNNTPGNSADQALPGETNILVIVFCFDTQAVHLDAK
jgi:hypothetical protein